MGGTGQGYSSGSGREVRKINESKMIQFQGGTGQGKGSGVGSVKEVRKI